MLIPGLETSPGLETLLYSSLYSAENALYGCIFPTISTVQFNSRNNSYLSCVYTPHSITSSHRSRNAGTKYEGKTYEKKEVTCDSSVQFIKDTFVDSILEVDEASLTVTECNFTYECMISSLYNFIYFSGYTWSDDDDDEVVIRSYPCRITQSAFAATCHQSFYEAINADGEVSIGECTFTEIVGSSGAAISVFENGYDKKTLIYSCNFSSITSSFGAVCYSTYGDSQLVIANCYFEKCIALYLGGAIVIDANSQSYNYVDFDDPFLGHTQRNIHSNTKRAKVRSTPAQKNRNFSVKKEGNCDVAIRHCAFSDCSCMLTSYGGLDIFVAAVTTQAIKEVESSTCPDFVTNCTTTYTGLTVKATDCYTNNPSTVSFYNIIQKDASITQSTNPAEDADVTSKPDLSDHVQGRL